MAPAQNGGALAAVRDAIATGAVVGAFFFLVGTAGPQAYQAWAVTTAQVHTPTLGHLFSGPAVRTTTMVQRSRTTASLRASSEASTVVPSSVSADAKGQGPLAALVGCVAFAAAFLVARVWKPANRHAVPPMALLATAGELPRRAVLAGAIAASGLSACPSALAIGPRKLPDAIQQVVAQKSRAGALNIRLEDIVRLVFHDAVTFDRDARSGGCNGSIRFPEELERPENAGLAPVVSQLLELQKDIQAETGTAVTFSDVMAVTGGWIIAHSFKDALCAKTDEASCDILYNGYGNKPPAWRVGRVDASKPEPAGRVPWTGSSAEEFKEAAKRVGLTVKELCCLAPGLLESEEKALEVLGKDPQCASILKELEATKATTTRTSYEVNFFRGYTKLINLAVFNEKMYS